MPTTSETIDDLTTPEHVRIADLLFWAPECLLWGCYARGHALYIVNHRATAWLCALHTADLEAGRVLWPEAPV